MLGCCLCSLVEFLPVTCAHMPAAGCCAHTRTPSFRSASTPPPTPQACQPPQHAQFSKPQLMAALARLEQMAEEAEEGERRVRLNQPGSSPWECLDYGDVVIHLFTAEQRWVACLVACVCVLPLEEHIAWRCASAVRLCAAACLFPCSGCAQSLCPPRALAPGRERSEGRWCEVVLGGKGWGTRGACAVWQVTRVGPPAPGVPPVRFPAAVWAPDVTPPLIDRLHASNAAGSYTTWRVSMRQRMRWSFRLRCLRQGRHSSSRRGRPRSSSSPCLALEPWNFADAQFTRD